MPSRTAFSLCVVPTLLLFFVTIYLQSALGWTGSHHSFVDDDVKQKSELSQHASQTKSEPIQSISELAMSTSLPNEADSPTQVTDSSPILALSYSRAPGPRKCRGHLIHTLSVPRPASQWLNGSCVNLLQQAHCGMFVAGKEDRCEAQLFIDKDCRRETYTNTAVFGPEQHPIGGSWRSMWVRCGIELPMVAELNAEALGIEVTAKDTP